MTTESLITQVLPDGSPSSVLANVITQASANGKTNANPSNKVVDVRPSNINSKSTPDPGLLVKSPTSPSHTQKQPRGFLSLLLCCTSRAFLDLDSPRFLNLAKQAPVAATSPAADPPHEEERKVPQEDAIVEEEHLGHQGKEEPCWLLAPLAPEDSGRKCLVLDLDETLVHSSFKVVQKADFVVPVEIENQIHNVYVMKRPGVDEFLKRVGEFFEVVVFTASLAKYADPVLDLLDIHKVVKHRLFRESCYQHKGNYVKDLSQLGRDLRNVVIIDNSPVSYIFHPMNAVPVSSWFSDPHDTELLDMLPFLQDLSTSHVEDVVAVLDNSLEPNKVDAKWVC
ncbi:uncharacterized protein VTP21DRAFT_7988 [Calcarisporiella thermophila]|uniref:uncharacterized protein n=1 Tax=Calcarisporiella thermophila TaxID=911321 RepID=UPI003742F52C